MTAIYWAWKNLKDVDVIGLCHYRRYFDFHHQTHREYMVVPTVEYPNLDLSVPPSIIDSLKPGEVILRTPTPLPFSVATHYCTLHQSDDLRVLEQVFEKTQPEEMKRAFREVMHNGNKYSPYNMFIMRYRDFEGYCKWLFPLLKELEQKIDSTHYSPYQSRVLGFICERLLNVYIHAQHMKPKYYPVIWITDEENHYASLSTLSWYLFKLKNSIGFRILKRHH